MHPMHPMQMIKLVFNSNGLISCLVSTKNEFPLSIRRQSAILNRVVYSMTGVISISGIFSGLPGREFNLFQVKLTHDCCTFALHKDTFSSGRRKIFD